MIRMQEVAAQLKHKRTITWSEELWFWLRSLETFQMPPAARRMFVNRILRDPSLEDRFKSIGDREVLFVHVPKTGGTSLAKAFDLPRGHVPVSRFLARNPERFNASFKFAFVRNPWDRLYSAFSYLHGGIGYNTQRDARWAEQNLGRYEDFEDFVLSLKNASTWRKVYQWPHFRSQVDWLCVPGSTEVRVDYVGRFETLAQDVDQISAELGLSTELTHERKTRSAGNKAYTDEMKEIIGHRYRADAEILNYSEPA